MKKNTPRAKAKRTLAPVESALTRVTSRLDGLPARLGGARKLLSGARAQGAQLLKKHPGRAALAAFAAGVALTKIARRG
jgi:hypothetical protein